MESVQNSFHFSDGSPVLCKFVIAGLWLCVVTSIYIFTMISVARWLLLNHPLFYERNFQDKLHRDRRLLARGSCPRHPSPHQVERRLCHRLLDVLPALQEPHLDLLLSTPCPRHPLPDHRRRLLAHPAEFVQRRR